ncbi:MAG: bifunctional folylpolyglutamate synthase/dihydrofolate synthase [Bacteroidales bacterium]|nr:MAG: bifunctional folylpolyglutamate synthase/dihydrofolate synthase [Bacteroidales bacterium]
MDYQQTVDYLFSQLPVFQRIGKAAYKGDLNNTLALDEYFNHPHRTFKTIHVAGTNGKGSTSHMLASVLAKAGYKVGLYTSPHLKDFRERIRINGIVISEQEVVDFVEKHKVIFEKVKPSFFEMTVALAFDYFSRQKVDIAVVEVGLGGRLDSTNIITPELSVITNISLDHTDLLGDTLEEIAFEKAGVIKPNIPVIISQTQPEIKHVFLDKAQSAHSPILFADEVYTVFSVDIMKIGYQTFSLRRKDGHTLKDIHLDLNGVYQKYNLPGVILAIDILNQKGYHISEKQLRDGLSITSASTGLLGRWQRLQDKPLIICDTGHNVGGIAHVLTQLNVTGRDKLHMVIGMVGDKNIDGVLSLLPKDAYYYFTKASIPRALDELVLADKAAKYNLNGNTFPTVKEALVAAKKNANPNDLIFIGGSTFIVAEVV